MKKDLDAMTPRELSAGLMRGDRSDMQLGYGPGSAALAAAQRNKLSEDDTRALLYWSLGFHDGLWDAMHASDPNVAESPKRPGQAENEQYLAGRIEGRSEAGFFLYPAAPEKDSMVARFSGPMNLSDSRS